MTDTDVRGEEDALDTYRSETELEEVDRSLTAALRASWYLWVGASLMGVLAAIALTKEISPSFVAETLFTTLTLVLGVAAGVRFLNRWEAVGG